MIANVKGNFEEFSGSFEYDQKTNTLKALEGKVAVKSIDTDTQKRDDHLRSADFFYVEKYPMMTFVLTKVVGDKAYGKLTMRGVTKDIELNVATSGMVVEDPWGHMRTGVVLNGTINRQDYGVAYNANMKSGGLMIGNEVKIEVVVEGIQVK
jgi:polyisoprenoid-binding protein YceI